MRLPDIQLLTGAHAVIGIAEHLADMQAVFGGKKALPMGFFIYNRFKGPALRRRTQHIKLVFKGRGPYASGFHRDMTGRGSRVALDKISPVPHGWDVLRCKHNFPIIGKLVRDFPAAAIDNAKVSAKPCFDIQQNGIVPSPRQVVINHNCGFSLFRICFYLRNQPL